MSNNQKLLSELMSDDPLHLYTEKELDDIEAIDVVMALRIAKVQHLASAVLIEYSDVEIDIEKLNAAINEIKDILSMDGGDIALIAVEDRTVQVQMRGACVGCPNAVLDLKNVVERIIFRQVPGVKKVVNTF